ncbi:MAG: HEAT repeat domain-containing protein, partial [Cyanobacteria bacterium P01_G01_bin.39]
MSRQVKRKRNGERSNLERRLEKLREQKAKLGINADPRLDIEIEDIEEELEQLRVAAEEVSNLSQQKKISSPKLNKARSDYLEILEKDVKNRLKTSIHNARFIDINSKQSLDSTYLPWIYQGDENPEVFNRFEEAFEKFEHRVLLLGAPGSGKTTTLLHVAQQLIRQAQDDSNAPIPLLFNLSKFRDKDNRPARHSFLTFHSQRSTQKEQRAGAKVIEDWLVQMMTEYADPFGLRKFSSPWVSQDVANYWLREEKVALLLDGLDEVDDRQLLKLVDYLNSYLRRHPDITVVVCSRIVEYQPLKDKKETRLQLVGAVTLRPLNQQQIASYLEKADAIALRDTLFVDQTLYELAQTPLTLSVMTLAYGGMAPQDIPADLSLVDRRRHLFDTYIDRMMQRKARRDRGIPFDLNPDNDVPERKYPYSREQVNRYLGWLAVRLSERMQTVLPYDRLYSFLAQEPENQQNQSFWTEVRLTNAVFIALSIIAITILLMPKTALGIKQAVRMLGFLLPSSLFLSFVTKCIFLERFDNQKVIHNFINTITCLSIVIVFMGAFGGVVSSLAAVLPITFDPSALGAVAAVIIYVVLTLNNSEINLSYYLSATAVSIILPLVPILFNKSIPSLGIAASIAVAQWIFLVMKWLREDEGVWYAFVVSPFEVAGVALLGGLSVSIIAIQNWDETIILLGLLFGIFGFLEENPRPIILFLITLAALIGGCAANSIGSLVGATATLAIIGLTFLYDEIVGETLIEKTRSSIPYSTDRLLYNLIVKSVLTVNRSIPANCNRLLNYAISALLLKRVGTEYEFIHRLLRDHFAIRELVPTLGGNTELTERIQSIERLSFQGESAFDTLVALTQDQDPLIREAAIKGLGRVAIPEVVPLLQIALEDSSIQVRKAVIKNLGKLPEKDSEMILSKALENQDLSVQLLSLSISRERDFDFNDNDSVREALKPIIANTSFPEILKTLQDSDASVRYYAAVALGKIGDSTAVAKLIEALGDHDDWVRYSAQEALVKIGDSTAVAKLIEALGGRDDSVRYYAAVALGQIGDSTAVAKLIEALGDRDDSVRYYAAVALGQIGDSRAVAKLIEALGDRKDSVRSSAAAALGEIGDSKAVPKLIKALGDRDYWVRSSAASALGQIGDSRAVPKLIKALGDRNDSVRSSAASALGQMGDSRAVPKLIQTLGDRKDSVRRSAASALGQIGDSTAVPKLIQALGDRDYWVRSSAASALGQIGDSTAVPKLIQALSDRKDSVGSSAAYALGQIGDNTAVPKLIQTLGDRNDWVGSSAAKALGQIGDSTAVPKLIEALGDGNYSVSSSAAEALGQIGDSTAVSGLIEALSDRKDWVGSSA